MIADGFIKSLRSIQFKRFIDQLRMIKRKTMWKNNKELFKDQKKESLKDDFDEMFSTSRAATAEWECWE
jgi:hypothetical protein